MQCVQTIITAQSCRYNAEVQSFRLPVSDVNKETRIQQESEAETVCQSY